jgi:hypothetical protein
MLCVGQEKEYFYYPYGFKQDYNQFLSSYFAYSGDMLLSDKTYILEHIYSYFLALPNHTLSLLMITIILQLFVLTFLATFQKAHHEKHKQT